MPTGCGKKLDQRTGPAIPAGKRPEDRRLRETTDKRQRKAKNVWGRNVAKGQPLTAVKRQFTDGNHPRF
jgi:hypothetical protein